MYVGVTNDLYVGVTHELQTILRGTILRVTIFKYISWASLTTESFAFRVIIISNKTPININKSKGAFIYVL